MNFETSIDASKTPHAASFWNEHYETLKQAGVLKGEDALLFVELCYTYELLAKAREGLFTDGLSQVDRIHGGMLRKSHYFQIWKDAMATFLVLSKKFAILPADRKEFGAKEAKSFDLEDILSE